MTCWYWRKAVAKPLTLLHNHAYSTGSFELARFAESAAGSQKHSLNKVRITSSYGEIAMASETKAVFLKELLEQVETLPPI
jgi:hypothetical protein